MPLTTRRLAAAPHDCVEILHTDGTCVSRSLTCLEKERTTEMGRKWSGNYLCASESPASMSVWLCIVCRNATKDIVWTAFIMSLSLCPSVPFSRWQAGLSRARHGVLNVSDRGMHQLDRVDGRRAVRASCCYHGVTVYSPGPKGVLLLSAPLSQHKHLLALVAIDVCLCHSHQDSYLSGF